MSKSTRNEPAKIDPQQEARRIAWTLAKADLQAVALRLDAIIKVGTEDHLGIVARVVGELQEQAATIARNLIPAETPETAQ